MPRCSAADESQAKIIIQSGKGIIGDTREKIFRKGVLCKRDERH